MTDEQLFNFLNDVSYDRAVVNFLAVITWGANVQTCTIKVEDDIYCSFGKELSKEDIQNSIGEFPLEAIPFTEPGLYNFTSLVKVETDSDDYRQWVMLDFLHSEVHFVISSEKMKKDSEEFENSGDTFLF